MEVALCGQIVFKHLSCQISQNMAVGLKVQKEPSTTNIQGYFVGTSNQTTHIQVKYGWSGYMTAWTGPTFNLDSGFVYPIWVKFIITEFGGTEWLFIYVSNDPVVSWTWVKTANIGSAYIAQTGYFGVTGIGIQELDDITFTQFGSSGGFDPYSAADLVPSALPTVLLNALLQDWKGGARIESAYMTDVAPASNLAEERRSLVDRPQRSVLVSNLGFSKAKSWEVISNLRRMGNERTVVPLVTDHARITASSTGVTLNCVTSYRRFFAGGRVVVCKLTKDGEIYDEEYDTIASLTASTITLDIGVSGTFPAGSRVYPCIEAEVSLSNSARLIGDRFLEMDFTAEELFGPTALRRTEEDYPSSFEVVTINAEDFPVFMLHPDQGFTNEIMILRKGEQRKQGRSTLVSTHGSRPQTGYRLNFQKASRADAWPLIEFFDSRKGRCRPFVYIPMENYWDLDAIDTTYLEIDAIGNFEDLSFIDFIAVVMKDGTFEFIEVDSRVDNTTVFRFTWTEAITAPALADVHRVVPAYIMRLESDAMDEDWVTDEFLNTSLEFIELLNEEDVTLECLF
jgi:hypothetical protein